MTAAIDLSRTNPDTVKFAIFSVARSGTSYLTTALRTHPEIMCHGEALLPRHIPKHLQGAAKETLEAEHCKRDPLDFLSELYALDEGHKAVGFKVFRGHSPNAHEAILKNPHIRKVILKRENHLASFSSMQVAKATGKWSLHDPSKRKEAKVPFNPDQFRKYMNGTEHFFEFVRDNAAGPVLDITYEEHILPRNLSPILPFLDVDPDVEIDSNKVKQGGRSILERFENADEVSELLEEVGRPDWAKE